MAEAAVALSYPEPERQGKFLGLWLVRDCPSHLFHFHPNLASQSFRIGGQVVGGAINLGINAKRNEAGSVSYTVYLIFIALRTSTAPLLLLNYPDDNRRMPRPGRRLLPHEAGERPAHGRRDREPAVEALGLDGVQARVQAVHAPEGAHGLT